MKDVLISCTQIRKKKKIMLNCKHNLTLFINHLLSCTDAGGDLVRVCAYTSMVSVCVSEGTHSMASSVQQPPHRLTDTQDGIKRWCVSSGNSRQTSTRVSRGSQPLLEYTSNHRRTGGDKSTKSFFISLYQLHEVVQDSLQKQEAYLLDLPWILGSLLAASEQTGGRHKSNECEEHCFNKFRVSRASRVVRKHSALYFGVMVSGLILKTYERSGKKMCSKLELH